MRHTHHTFADFLYQQQRRILSTLAASERRIRKARRAELEAADAEWRAERRLGNVPQVVRKFGLDYYDRQT